MYQPKFRKLSASSLCVGALLASMGASSKASAAEEVSCSTAINALMATNPLAFYVFGTRATARNSHGFSSFSMEDGFQIENVPVNDPEFPRHRTFAANRRDARNYEGPFHEVFTDRGNGAEARTHFWVREGGQFWLRSITYNTSWQILQGVQCFEGPQEQLVVRGHLDNPGFGTDYWTFVLKPDYLI